MNIRFEYIGDVIKFLTKIEALNLSPRTEIILSDYDPGNQDYIRGLIIVKRQRTIVVSLNTMDNKEHLEFDIVCNKCAGTFESIDIEINVCDDCGAALRKEDEHVGD